MYASGEETLWIGKTLSGIIKVETLIGKSREGTKKKRDTNNKSSVVYSTSCENCEW